MLFSAIICCICMVFTSFAKCFCTWKKFITLYLVLDSRFLHITEMVLSGGCGLYLLADYNCWFWKWVLAEVVTWHRLTFVNGCHWSKLQYNMVRKLIFQVLQKYLPTMVIMNYFWWMVVVLYEKNYTRTLFGIYKRYYILCSRCSVCQWRHS